jgi:hypothetical protein
MDGHLDPCAIPGQMLVDGVVENLKDAVVESALIRVADVHAGAFADRLQAFELVDLSRTVFLASRSVLFLGDVAVVEGNDGFCGFFFSHGKDAGVPGKGGFVMPSRVWVEGRAGNAFLASGHRIWGAFPGMATRSGNPWEKHGNPEIRKIEVMAMKREISQVACRR